MRFPYLIIDSDNKSNELIQLAMETYDDSLCVGITSDEQEGLDLILERGPALVFLNLELPGLYTKTTGYYLINELYKYVNKVPEFVVLASNKNYAIEGIRNGVLDYILKPSLKSPLFRAIKRFRKKNENQDNKTLCLKSYGDYRFVNTDEVLYLKADNNTTDIVNLDGSTTNAFKTLKYFQESLPSNFIRIHNSYIVNRDYISRIHFGKNRCMMKSGDRQLPFSKSYKENVETIKNTLEQRSLFVV